MKKITVLFLFIMTLGKVNSQSIQPDWKFPIAFEDATGAKDTIYLVWDSAATFYGIDTVLGEFPINLDTNVFNVYLTLWGGYNSKTWAVDQLLPLEQSIYAINYTYPIVISWDSSLFHSASITSPVTCAEMDNDYFFYFGGPCQVFNMLSSDTVLAPVFNWWSQDHFPLAIRITRDLNVCCVNSIPETARNKSILIYPNPTDDIIIIKSDTDLIDEINIYSMENRNIGAFKINKEKECFISTEFLAGGIFIIEIINNSKIKYYEKIIKY